MSFDGKNYLRLEDGSGVILLEQNNSVTTEPDKLLLELSASGASIDNNEAVEDSQNRFNICHRSGFKALPGELVKDGYGAWVLPKYAEPRHLQDFVKTIPDRQEGSRKPEHEDLFITDEIKHDP